MTNKMESIRNIFMAAVIAITAAAATSCYVRISDEAKKDLKRDLELRIESRGQVYSESDSIAFHPGTFSGISSVGAVDIEFIMSDCEPVVSVFGTHVTRDSVKVEVIDGKLFIYTSSPLMYDEHIRIYAPAVEEIETKGSADFKGTIAGEKLQVANLGSGDMTLHLADVGDLKVSSSGSGDIVLTGKAREATIHMAGSGDMDALGLDAEKISASSHGSGDMVYRKDGKTVRKD